MKKIILSNNKFNLFMQLFSLLSKSCNDFTIKNGAIRQMSSSKTLIFDISLSDSGFSEFDDTTLYMTNLTQKEKLLSVMCRQGEDLNIIIDTDYMLFYDEFTKIRPKQPVPSLLEHTYMEKDEVVSKLKISEENCFLRCNFDSFFKQRLTASATAIASTRFNVIFENNQALFLMASSGNATSIELKLVDLNEQNKITKKAFSTFDVETFGVNSKTFDVSMYYNVEKQAIIMNTKSVISAKDDNDEESINIETWSISNLTSEEE